MENITNAESIQSFLVDTIIEFGETANQSLNKEDNKSVRIKTIKDINFDESVDNAEQYSREILLSSFRSLFNNNNEVSALLKDFFGNDVSLTEL